jgi:hypothetical protein
LGNWLQGLAFWGVFYVSLWRWVDVRLIYHGGGEIRGFPVFYWGWDFLRETCRYPGGGARYLAALLAQSLYYSWWGALVLALQAGLVFWGARAVFKSVGAARPELAAYVPPLILLALYAGYHHASTPVTSLTLAAGALGLFAWLGGANRWFRAGLLLFFSALLYAVAAEALLVFSLGATMIELHRRAPLPWMLFPLLAAGIVAWLDGWFIFGYAPSEALGTLLSVTRSYDFFSAHGARVIVVLYLALPMLAFALVLRHALAARWPSFSRRISDRTPTRHSPRTEAGAGRIPHDRTLKTTGLAGRFLPARRWIAAAGGWKLETALLLVATLGVVALTLDPRIKTLLAVDYFAWRQKWPQVLKAAGKAPMQPDVRCSVAQAAYHTGTLVRTLPPVRPPADLLLADQAQWDHWKQSDLMFDLGYANMALHHLIEAVEFCGERPMLLQRIALVNLAIGNTSTARIYLNALTHVPFHAGWARAELAALETDPGLARNEDVQRLRADMPKTDTVARLSVEGTLLLLLNANPHNRMAFEYLMTYYLLSRNLAGFAANLPRRDDFPGFEVPPLWEEAKVLAALRLGPIPALQKQSLDPAARQRLATVLDTLRASNGDKAKAHAMLPSYYEQSYLVYYFFH